MTMRWVVSGLMVAAVVVVPSPMALGAAGASVAQTNAALASFPAEERGDILMARGEYLAAVEAYKGVPANAQVLNKTGIAYHHLLAIDLAKKDYEKALLIKPNYPEALNNLGA